MLPECLDDWIDESNPVRALDAFVDALDLAKLGFEGVAPEVTGATPVQSANRRRDRLQSRNVAHHVAADDHEDGGDAVPADGRRDYPQRDKRGRACTRPSRPSRHAVRGQVVLVRWDTIGASRVRPLEMFRHLKPRHARGFLYSLCIGGHEQGGKCGVGQLVTTGRQCGPPTSAFWRKHPHQFLWAGFAAALRINPIKVVSAACN